MPFTSGDYPTLFCGGHIDTVTKEDYVARATQKKRKIVTVFWDKEMFSLAYIVGFNLSYLNMNMLYREVTGFHHGTYPIKVW